MRQTSKYALEEVPLELPCTGSPLVDEPALLPLFLGPDPVLRVPGLDLEDPAAAMSSRSSLGEFAPGFLSTSSMCMLTAISKEPSQAASSDSAREQGAPNTYHINAMASQHVIDENEMISIQ